MPQASKERITWYAAGLCLGLALLLPAAGCGGSSTSNTVTVTISPTAVTALVGSFVQFSVTPSSNVDGVSFFVNDVAGGNSTVGTISLGGLYQAPSVIPANTTITVRATASNSGAGTSADATAAVTLDSGVRLRFVPTSFTIGTGEQFQFGPKVQVSGVPLGVFIPGVCGDSSTPPCNAVTWGATSGSIDGSGFYTAPGNTGSDTITATSIYDTSRKVTATVTLVTPVDPTLTSISNDVGAVGATQQDIYLSGSNFISTTQVRANGNLVASTDVVSSSVLRVRLSGSDLKAPVPPGPLTFTASAQRGADQSCSTTPPTACQLTLSSSRPAFVGADVESFSAGNTATLNVDGGFFGTNTLPAVTAKFGSQASGGIVHSANTLEVALSGSDTSTPGLVPVTVAGNVSGRAVANVAVQPTPASLSGLSPSATPAVGTQPSSVAINTATGVAVVANLGSNSVALFSMASPGTVKFICTATAGSSESATDAGCPASGPTSVAVDNMRNLALVTNSLLNNVAVIDLAATPRRVREVVSVGFANIAPKPWAVGINSLTGRAVVAYQVAGFATLVDLNQTPAVVAGIVAISTGATPRVAVSPKLNWAMVTPGGAGSMGIVDLSPSRQSTNGISSAVRSSNVVTISTSTAHTLRPGDPVLISGVADPGFNGVFNVTGVSGNTFTYSQTAANVNSGGGTAGYELPVATVATSLSVVGVAINDETQKAVLVDPVGTTPVLVYNLLDQTSATVSGPAFPSTGNNNDLAAAFSPFTNVAITVNKGSSTYTLIDPATPATLATGTFSGLNRPVDVAIDPGTNTAVIVNQDGNSVSIFSLGTIRSQVGAPLTPQVLQVSRQDNGAGPFLLPELTLNSTLTTGATANPQTLTIIGGGFVSGASAVTLDGVALSAGTTVVDPSGRKITAVIPAALLTGGGPRISSLQVVNGASASNATSFTISQSIDVTSAGCSSPAPQSVAIDYSSRNLAIVSNPGCNNIAIISLANGTGRTVAVGNNPQGVAVYIQPALAVVANANDNTVSIVDINGNTVVATVNTDPTPIGVAVDPGLGLAVVTASNANVIDTFTISSTPGTATSLPVQSRPQGVVVDPRTHIAAIANTTSNSVSLVDLTQSAATIQVPASGFPAGIALDPVSGSYLAVASLNNQLLILDPVNQRTTPVRIGINPTSVAYNFNSSTLVTTNGISQTMSVMDFVTGRVRALFSFKASGRFAVDIHPFSNLAVIADSADNRVILRPLPR